MYDLEFTKSSFKFLKKLSLKESSRIINVIERSRIRPYSHVKKLVGSPYFRLRSGIYRIIVDIIKDKLIIMVIDINHRKKIYKK